jgi:hypothetical protein
LIQPAEPHHGRERHGELDPHAVALQVEFERQILKPVFHLIGFRLWVSKVIGYGLWVNLIQRAEPHRAAAADSPPGGVLRALGALVRGGRRDGAVQVHPLESKRLKAGKHFIGSKSKVCNRFSTMGQGARSRVETRRFQAMGQLASQLVQPPTAM